MINSLDVRKFIETDKYQSHIKELSENYQVKMTKNDWAAQEIVQKGKAVLYDGTVLTAETDRQAVIDSICLSGISLWVDFDDKTVSDFSIDLSTEQPDYFGGHTLTIEVDEDKEMSFGGMNG